MLLEEYPTQLKGYIRRKPGNLRLSDLEFADEADLANVDTTAASERMTTLSENCKPAGMEISVPKTKVQYVQKRPKVSPTTEDDIAKLPKEKQFKHKCDSCEMTYPSKHGLNVHRGRFCKGPGSKKPSRRGTVADRIITRMKVEEHNKSLPKVKMGDKELENTYSFVYLGAEIPGDGDQSVTLKHRSDIAWVRFNEYRTVLTSTKLPVHLRIRLYIALIICTLVYGASAWLFDEKIRRSLNGINSKMLSAITGRSIHEEASEPTYDVVHHVLDRRKAYLGHILRMEPDRAVRRYLLELNPSAVPFVPGSLLDDTEYETVEEAIAAAQDRVRWQGE